MVAAIFFFYFLHGIKAIADKFSTMELKLNSMPFKTFNFRFKSKEGLELTFLAGFSFEEVSL